MGWLPIAFAPLAMLAAVPTMLEEPTQSSGVDTIDTEQDRYDRLTVPVTIGEHGPFEFMIDTGAQATVVSHAVADRLGLVERRPAILIGMASQLPIEVVTLEDLALGSRKFDISIAPLVPDENLAGADGILGVDSLQNQRVLLDFRKGQIFVADADALGGNGGYEIVVKARRELGQLIITKAHVDGVKTNVIIDTGAQSSIGNLALQEKLKRQRDYGVALLTDINGIDLESSLRLASTLELGNIKLNNVAIAFVDAPPFEALGLGKEPTLILGLRELRAFRRVAIDFETSKVYFDIPDRRNDPGVWRVNF